MKKIVRLFEEKDRNSIKKICADTGFLGKPIDSIFKDRKLFSDMIVNPYLDFEPKHTFVSEEDGNVVAYVMGSNTPGFEKKMAWNIAKYSVKMFMKLILGKYNSHPRSKEYVKWFFTKGLHEVPKAPKGMPHAHINVDSNYRGNSRVSYEMITCLENILRNEGEEAYYGRVFVSNRRTLRSYERYGAKEYDRKEITAFKKERGEELIYKVTIVIPLFSGREK